MSQLATLKRQRGACKAPLTHLEEYVASYRENDELLETLQTKIEFVQNTWAQFEEVQVKIEALEEADIERPEMEDRYCRIVGRARALVNSIQNPSRCDPGQAPNVAAGNGVKVKLPTMNIPVFDGNPEKWLEFRDSFQGLIEANHELSNIQRMYYLKSSLNGRAAEVVQDLETSSNNYPIAWNLLTKRFEDKRAISARHFQLLLDIPCMQRESGSQLRQTLDSIRRHIRALEQLGANTWDALINHLMISKFDSATRREWRAYIREREDLDVTSLTDFLEERCAIVEPETSKLNTGKSSQPRKFDKQSVSQHKRSENSNAFTVTRNDTQVTRKCALCDGESHALYACRKFKELSIPQRLSAVNEHRLCRNCLRANHFAEQCHSSGCKKCTARHNTLLHPTDEKENATASSSATPTESKAGISGNHSTSVNCTRVSMPIPSRVLLSTARVWIHDAAGTLHDCRVLLDSGSQSNFLTNELCERLNLNPQPFQCTVGGMASSINLTEAATAVVQSKHNAYQIKVRFLLTKRIIEQLPISQIEVRHLQIPTNIKLADDTFNSPGKVDMILGASVFWGLLCIGQIKLGRDQPILQKTHLGWIVAGDIASKVQPGTSVCCFATEKGLREQVERFWTIEEVDQGTTASKNDQWCEEHFLRTRSRDQHGRFTVSLPFREDPSELGESRSSALHRLYRLEKRLDREPSTREEYRLFMAEYAELNHMTPVKCVPSGESTPAYYIPHHAVVTYNQNHAKLRVVFDASAKTSSGKSLNDILRVGPTIQETLFSIVLRFRQHQYVLTADIVKMYRQVNLQEDQRRFQRILWRPSSDAPVEEFQLNTVTYGIASAPFLAIRALHQAAIDARTQLPEASEVVIRDFYVDDLLTGHDDLTKLKCLKKEIDTILESAGFELAKWKSNEPTVLTRANEEFTRLGNVGDGGKTLGLYWAPIEDTVRYHVAAGDMQARVTKRSILSTVSQIFDPLGLVGPSTIRAKILLQRLWQLNLGWDESVPVEIHTEWTDYVEALGSLNDISIPRGIMCQGPTHLEIHGFADASENAYGACVYLRSVDHADNVTIRLICAKSKVAPLKTICIPRLELCGALLLARLCDSVIRAFTIPPPSRYYWCDSTIVLAWIHSEPCLRKTFVANRVTEIQQLTSQEQWRHVRSENNPADVISRGISPEQLKGSQIWWQGPTWLRHPEEQLQKPVPVPTGDLPESKGLIVVATQVVEEGNLLERFSSWSRLKRVVAYCLRWRHYRSESNLRRTPLLTVDELKRATTTILRLVQRKHFSREVEDLRTKQRMDLKSQLLTLHPFLDSDNIIRVGGQLRNAPIPYSRRYPAVIPANHHVTSLIIRDAHYRSLHAGAQALMSELQASFWILSAKSTIRKVLHKCIVCFRARPTPTRHLMGDLPESRVSIGRAFVNVGVDYGGPFNLKLSRNKTCKSYICLFVCMRTKAIHLELVSDLSTAAFLNALKRFVAHRGKCAHIYSDNGTNFKGASGQLREFYEFLTHSSHHEALDRFTGEQEIQWHFIPPYSPHLGGLWEAGIKSVKTHLQRVLSEALLTFEEMYTVLVQIEAVLNSRPLTPITNDPTDFQALTPGHFLIGTALNAIPEREVEDAPVNRLTRFQYLATLTQQFWARWSTEYLSSLQQRFKWNRVDNVSAIDIGTMVVLQAAPTLSKQWVLGRIVECHKGKDGHTRVVSVRTARGVVERAVAKICILPIET